MATSGSTSVTVTSWDTLKFSWSRTSYSVANNTSTISWTMQLIAGSSGRISSSVSKNWSVTVNGTKYSGTNTVGISNNTTKTLASGTTTISHNSDGSKTFSYSFSQQFSITFSGSSIGTKSGSGSGTLDTIPRASSLTAANGTLGTAQTLTISRADSTFKHKITYTCGSTSGYAAGSSTSFTNSTSISWTPPLSLASQNTTGTSVSITLYLKTYTSGGTQIGSVTKTISCSIPSSVKPSVKLTVTDPTGHSDTYGAFVKGLSRFKVVVTPTLSYSSPIASYSTTANGAKYTAASFTTGVLSSYGTLTVSTTIKDKRGRTASASVSKTVLNYSAPVVSRLTVKRCDEDGSDNDQGEYVQVTFSAKVTDLNSLNAASYTLKYKKSADSTYTEVGLDDYANVYSITNATYIFEADASSSYDVEFTAADNHTSTKRTTSASTAFTLMHWNAAGNGMGIGKLAELENVLDVGLQTRLNGGLLYVVLEPETDLNDVRTPNFYVGANVTNYGYANCPLQSGTFTLHVFSGGESGQTHQHLVQCNKDGGRTWDRWYYQSSWGGWIETTPYETSLYHLSGGSNETITLSETADNFKYLEIFFVDNNGAGKGYYKYYVVSGTQIDLSLIEASSASNTIIRRTRYSISGTTITPNTTTAGYWQFNGNASTHSINSGTNYIYIYRVVGIR